MAGVSTAADLADSTAVASTAIGFTMAGSTTIDLAIAGFSSVDRSDIPGGAIIQTMAIMTIASLTPRRPGITVPILQAITLM